MSGEASKNSGEIGESITTKLLDILGWKGRLSGFNIPCSNKQHLGEQKNPRKGHGIDQTYIYNSPFNDNFTDVIFISIKNNINGYKKPSGVKSDFKKHTEDLNEAISCAKTSEFITSTLKAAEVRKSKRNVGLLIWLHSDLKTLGRSLIPDIKSLRVSENIKQPIYLIDSARATFLVACHDDLNKRYPSKYSYYFPKLGSTIAPLQERYDSYLPLELVASNVIPVRIENGEKLKLALYTTQCFDQDCLLRLVSLALDFSDAWVEEIEVCFPDYNPATHKDSVQKVNLVFSKRKKTIRVLSYTPSILNLLSN